MSLPSWPRSFDYAASAGHIQRPPESDFYSALPNIWATRIVGLLAYAQSARALR